MNGAVVKPAVAFVAGRMGFLFIWFRWEVAPSGHTLCLGTGPCVWRVRRGRVEIALVKRPLRASCGLCFFPGRLTAVLRHQGTGVSGTRAWPGHRKQQLCERGLSDGQQSGAWLLVKRPSVCWGLGAPCILASIEPRGGGVVLVLAVGEAGGQHSLL